MARIRWRSLRVCDSPNCHSLTQHRYCRVHRAGQAPAPTRSEHFRLCRTLSEIANLCEDISTMGVDARAQLTGNGIALHFDNMIEPPRREDIDFAQLLTISNADETTEFMQSILLTFARAQAKEANRSAQPQLSFSAVSSLCSSSQLSARRALRDHGGRRSRLRFIPLTEP